MKKWIFYLLYISIVCACTENFSPEKFEINRKCDLELSVSAYQVVKKLVDIDKQPLFEEPLTDCQLRIQYFVYDSTDHLVDQNALLSTKFKGDFRLSSRLRPGKYTLVTTADFVASGEFTEGGMVSYWEFLSIDSLTSFKIKDKELEGKHHKALGVNKMEVKILSDTVCKFDILPVGALMTFYFTNITGNYGTIEQVEYEWSKGGGYYQVASGKNFSGKAGSEVVRYPVSTGFYDQRYFLPDNMIQLRWRSQDRGGLSYWRNCYFSPSTGDDSCVEINIRYGTYNFISLE